MKVRKNNRTRTPSKESSAPVAQTPPVNRAGVPASSRAREVLPALLLVAATVVVYLPAIRGGFVWDDDSWTTNSLRLFRSVSGLGSMWVDPKALQQYFPLSGSTFWLDYQLWKFWLPPYHVENILLHALSVVLFWRLLLRLEVPGAWLAAAMFAVHPVMVESVAWITERKNVLSLALYLGSLLAYERCGKWTVRTDQPAESSSHRNREKIWCFTALVLFLCAMLAKATTCALPAVLLLLAWWKRGRLQWRADIVPALPFFALTLGLCALTVWLEKTHLGAQGPAFALGFSQRVLIAGRAFWFYPGKLVWPASLCFVYPPWDVSPGLWWQWLFPLAAVVAFGGVWEGQKRFGRGPATALFYYVGTLFPLIGFVTAYAMRYSFVWDHWVYLPSLGLFALAAALVTHAARRWRSPAAAIGFAVVVLPVLGLLTWRQCGMYADLETLWHTTLARNPACWLAYNNLAYARLHEGKVDEAIALCQKALLHNPRFAEAWNNLGNALLQKGHVDYAITDFQKAAAIDPDYAEVRYNYGNALSQQGRVDEAVAQYQAAIRIKPWYAEAHDNLGSTLLAGGDVNGAIAECQAALTINPDLAEAHNNLASALLQLGRVDDVIAECRKALALRPGFAEAHYNLANALLQKNQAGEAVAHYQTAIALKPGFADAEINLGTALLQEKRLDDAITHLRNGLALSPNSADACYTLGSALIQKGGAEEGIRQLQRALEIQPGFAAPRTDLDRIAWMLATSPVAAARNGAKAVEIAEQTDRLSGGTNAQMAATLAAAYAEAGRFPEAVATARRALQLAGGQNNSALAAAVQAQLKSYQAGQPFRDTGAPH